ncbi:hypothetical protein NFI95_08690 [Acetobacteraceae bacterium KSS8]|uniref:Uncharacterized protein n=1 Tax=Endosaccharibacter trunci TaxID=2812733 RepID=A0ABT1W6M5_9PROT|nr:hypothetical protein [Acetobacteraceae bacterium KSS8]
MRAFLLLLLPLLLLAACAPPPAPAARGPLDLSSAPEPGEAPSPTLGPPAHTGGGRLGGP